MEKITQIHSSAALEFGSDLLKRKIVRKETVEEGEGDIAETREVETSHYPLVIEEEEVQAYVQNLLHSYKALPAKALRLRAQNHELLTTIEKEDLTLAFVTLTTKYKHALRASGDRGDCETTEMVVYSAMNKLITCALQYLVLELAHAERAKTKEEQDAWEAWVEEHGEVWTLLMSQVWMETTLISTNLSDEIDSAKARKEQGGRLPEGARGRSCDSQGHAACGEGEHIH